MLEITKEDKIKASADKMPPIDVEKVVLGSIILDNDQIINVFNIINADMFCYEVNSKIYNTMLHLYENKMKIDRVTLWQTILNAGYNSPQLTEEYISSLAEGDRIFRASYAQYYAMSIAERYGGELTPIIAQEFLNEAKSKKLTIEQGIELGQKYLLKLSNHCKKDDSFSNLYVDENILLENIEKKIDENCIIGLPFPIHDISYATDGMEKGRIYTLVAHSSVGKTTFMLQTCLFNAQMGKDILIGSFEMSAKELSLKMMCMAAKLNNRAINKPREYISELISKKTVGDYKGGLEFIKNKIAIGNSIIRRLPITIYENEQADIYKVRNAIEKYKIQNKKLDLLCLDHCGLMCDFNNEQTSLSLIYKKLKDYSKIFDIPVLALHQFSREVLKNTKDYYPNIFSLRGSESIFNNSDIILMIYRPGIYESLIREKPELKDVCQMVFGKARYVERSEPIDMIWKDGIFMDKFHIEGVELI